MAPHECHSQRLSVLNESTIITYDSGDEEFGATFTFTYKYIVEEWVLLEAAAASEPVIRGQVCRHNNREICINVDGDQFFNIKKLAEILKRHLQHWPVPPNKLDKFICMVLRKSSAAYVTMLDTQRNKMKIYVPVVIFHDHIYDERHDMDLAIRRSEEEEKRVMVPTAEWAIESLKRLKLPMDYADNCTICLEKIKGGCKAIEMPCSHMFHKDCIKPWLRTSHYCPVCRFQMPIDCTL